MRRLDYSFNMCMETKCFYCTKHDIIINSSAGLLKNVTN